MAFGGVMTALAVVILCMGSIIPVNTYVSPVLCILLTQPVLHRCGKTIGWCYYWATMLLGFLLDPDREAALVYGLVGYYPMVRPRIQKLGMVGKLLFFTATGGLSLWLSTLVLGIPLEAAWVTAVTLLLWDVLFVLVDRLLGLQK